MRNLACLSGRPDVFVFPSRTDTYGVVQLEALACGVPVAAYPVTGPIDVIAGHPIGVLNDDLRTACLDALIVSNRPAATSRWRAPGTTARKFPRQCEPVRDRTFSASRAA